MSASPRRKESAAVPRGYVEALSKLFARSPAEIEAERQARNPAPAPRMKAGTRQGPISAPERTQSTGVLPVPHLLPKRKRL